MIEIFVLLSVFAIIFLAKSKYEVMKINSSKTSRKKNTLPQNFKIDDQIIGINEKGKIQNVLYIDKGNKNICYGVSNGRDFKDFKLINYNKLKSVEIIEEKLKNKEEDCKYVKKLGVKFKLKNTNLNEIVFHFMNSDAYVLKKDFEYGLTYKMAYEYKDYFSKLIS